MLRSVLFVLLIAYLAIWVYALTLAQFRWMVKDVHCAYTNSITDLTSDLINTKVIKTVEIISMVFFPLAFLLFPLVCLLDTLFVLSENKLGALLLVFCLCPIVLFLLPFFFIPTSGSLNREWQKKEMQKADDDSSEWDEETKKTYLFEQNTDHSILPDGVVYLGPSPSLASVMGPIYISMSRSVCYFETKYDKELNKFISEHYDEICNFFFQNYLTFVYFPKLKERSVAYNFPGQQVPAMEGQLFNPLLDLLNPLAGQQELEKPRLIILNTKKTEALPVNASSVKTDHWYDRFKEMVFDSYLLPELSTLADEPELQSEEKRDLFLLKRIKEVALRLELHPNMAYRVNPYNNELEMIASVKAKVELLKKGGISQLVLAGLVLPDSKLSRLVVMNNCDIVLPDYNNLKIEMNPLPKALFFLFLRHPEGIAFDDISLHRPELTKIYNHLTRKTDPYKIKLMLDSILVEREDDEDVFKLCEKITRVREAFAKKIDDDLARNYYIRKEENDCMRISLNRDMVEWNYDFSVRPQKSGDDES